LSSAVVHKEFWLTACLLCLLAVVFWLFLSPLWCGIDVIMVATRVMRGRLLCFNLECKSFVFGASGAVDFLVMLTYYEFALQYETWNG